MIPVVVVGGYKRLDRCKHLALDPQFLQTLGIVMRQGGKLTGTVVEHAHLDPFLNLPGQDLQDLAPHFTFVHNEVFQEDEMLGLFQLDQHFAEFILAQGEVGDSGVVVDRVSRQRRI